jgi:hypothetical protein
MAGSVAHARTAAASAGVTNDPPLLFCLPATNRSTRSEPAQSVEVRTPRAVRIRAAVGTWQTATLETEFCGQRLSTARAANEPQRRWNGLGRPTTAATSRGNIVLFFELGNHVSLSGLLGGGPSPAKPVSCRKFPVFGPDQGNFLRPRQAANLPDQESNRIFNALIGPSATLQANRAETNQGIDLLRTGTSDQGCTTEQGN